MSTPTPEQLEELVAAAGELHAKLDSLNTIQSRMEGYKKLISETQTLLQDQRPLRAAAIQEVRAASARLRDALDVTDPVA